MGRGKERQGKKKAGWRGGGEEGRMGEDEEWESEVKTEPSPRGYEKHIHVTCSALILQHKICVWNFQNVCILI